MRRTCLLIFLLIPLVVFSQDEVGPDGYLLLWFLIIPAVVALIWIFVRWLKNNGKAKPAGPSFSFRRLTVDLKKDRKHRPNTLTLLIRNNRSRDVDIEAPVLLFRKLWSIRKFKLKGINRYQIYPLYLEAGKSHELRISLAVFHEHDRGLRKYYWAKILLQDTRGRKYASKYVTLRKSLFS
ncbi:hypothetical protein [Gaoshiqia sp. Z1-71]|uniref:hypothetical protein n=1 Tax=Gaoshiqia hydrogeniformans TaxID=3290090 RepID=UPI003BF811C4